MRGEAFLELTYLRGLAAAIDTFKCDEHLFRLLSPNKGEQRWWKLRSLNKHTKIHEHTRNTKANLVLKLNTIAKCNAKSAVICHAGRG
jgi:hypothetical protein